MKKHLLIFIPIIVVFLLFAFFNHRSVQSVNSLKITDVTQENNIVTVNGIITAPHRSVISVKTEIEGSLCYITVTGINDFFGTPKTDFKASFKNPNNSAVYLKDSKNILKIWENADFGKIIENTFLHN